MRYLIVIGLAAVLGGGCASMHDACRSDVGTVLILVASSAPYGAGLGAGAACQAATP